MEQFLLYLSLIQPSFKMYPTTSILVFVIPILISLLLISLFLILRSNHLRRRTLERNKISSASSSIKKASEKDEFWNEDEIIALSYNYFDKIESSKQNKSFESLVSFCSSEVLKEIINIEKSKDRYAKSSLDQVSVIAVNDEMKDDDDWLKVYLEGKIENIRPGLQIETAEYLYETFKYLWTLSRNSNTWKIIEIDYDVEDHELRELENFIE